MPQEGRRLALQQEREALARNRRLGVRGYDAPEFTDQFTAPLNDELAWLVGYGTQGAGNVARGLTGRPVEVSALDRARAMRQISNEGQDRFASEHPVQAFAGGLLGGAAMAPARGAAIPGLIGRLGTEAGLGAAYGAAEGDGVAGRLSGAGIGAGIGLALGGAAEVAVPAVSRLWGAMTRKAPAPSGGLMTGEPQGYRVQSSQDLAPTDTPESLRAQGYEIDPVTNTWARTVGTEAPPVEPDYPIRAFHGSPHSFDRFSLDKIGTGEGAQAYGHGLYFAESEDVARQYRNNLTRDVQYRADGSVWNPQNELQHLNVRVAANQNGDDLAATLERAYEAALRAEPGGQAARAAEADIAHLEAIRDSGGLLPNRLEVNGRPLDEIYRRYELRADNGSFPEAQADYDRLALLEQLQIDGDPYDILGSRRGDYSPEALDWFERDIVPGFKRPGSMYEVGINAHPDTFLDWDRPMAEQPESVRAALEDVLANVPGVRDNLQPYEIDTGPSNGSNLMGAFSEARPGDYRTAMTDELRQRGVNGIRYLDGNSRGVGEGSSNYVVFNDELVKILRKYGISGLGLMTGGAAIAGRDQEYPGPTGL